LETVKYITKKNLKNFVNEVEITPSKIAMDNVCSTKKICDAQGKITFGQLRELVESGARKRILVHMGEGGYKATLRLLPWFIPQLVLAGFAATWVRVVNKLLRPTLEETTNYKTWWGKTILKIFDLVEGELNYSDPLSKIFFISDGLMTMLDDKYKIKFSNYIANIANEKLDDEIVPDYFVENELRHWLNEKFFLDPPLQPKKIKDNTEETSLTEEYKKKVILEKAQKASYIREIVRDIITIFKKEDAGEFYLPEEFNEDIPYYELPSSVIAVELIIEPSNDVDDFLTNANFYRNEDIIVVKIVYNSNKKNKILYNLIGELNEIIAHELRHQHQRDTGLFDLDNTTSNEEEDGFIHYSKPEEIDAQVDGFKRMRDVTKRPFEELVRNWFRTHQTIHSMNPEDTKKVIDLILDYYRNS
jgi:hypothetical protein